MTQLGLVETYATQLSVSDEVRWLLDSGVSFLDAIPTRWRARPESDFEAEVIHRYDSIVEAGIQIRAVQGFFFDFSGPVVESAYSELRRRVDEVYRFANRYRVSKLVVGAPKLRNGVPLPSFLTAMSQVFGDGILGRVSVAIENLPGSSTQDLSEILTHTRSMVGFDTCIDFGNITCQSAGECDCDWSSVFDVPSSALIQINTAASSYSHQRNAATFLVRNGFEFAIEQPFGSKLQDSLALIEFASIPLFTDD